VGSPGHTSRCHNGNTARLARAGGASRALARAKAATRAKRCGRTNRTRGLAPHPVTRHTRAG
jgi:hypothetical protein